MPSVAAALTLVFALSFGAPAQQSAKTPTDSTKAPPIQGAVKLPTGQPVRYRYFFDHNALHDCVEVTNTVVCLTESGNVLRFDASTLHLTAQAVVPGRATALTAAGPDKILIGTQNGEIDRLDPATLDLKPMAIAEGKIVWLSRCESDMNQADGVVAVVDNHPEVLPWPGEPSKEFENRTAFLEGKQACPYSIKTYAPDGKNSFCLPVGKGFDFPTSYFLDVFGRLWMGTDRGEFGGQCSYMNLRTGAVHSVSKDISGVLGFVGSRDGRLLAYGGTSHLGFHAGYIALVKPEAVRSLSRFESDDWQRSRTAGNPPATRAMDASQAASPENLPAGPVDLMVDDEEAGGFWVVSAHTLYHTDEGLQRWTKIADLGGRWYGGRRYSVGNTPTVNRLLVDKSEPGSPLAVMGRDGLVRVSGRTVKRTSFGEQLESSVLDIWKTSIGTLLLGDDAGHTAWRLTDDYWQTLEFFPRRPPLTDGAVWDFAMPFGDDGTDVLASAGCNYSPGERDIVSLDSSGNASVMGKWDDSSDDWDTSFISTSAGVLLKLAESRVWVRQKSGWQEIGYCRLADARERRALPHGRRFLPVARSGSSEFFLDAQFGEFLRLTRESDRFYQLVPAVYGRHAAPTEVFDAAADGDGWILVATAHGLLRFRPTDGARKSIPGPPPGDEIKSICRDEDGRLWAAGDALYISSNEGTSWEPIKLPMLAKTYTKRVRPNPDTPRGIILALHDQGVVFIDW